jgi:hypothetical protein
MIEKIKEIYRFREIFKPKKAEEALAIFWFNSVCKEKAMNEINLKCAYRTGDESTIEILKDNDMEFDIKLINASKTWVDYAKENGKSLDYGTISRQRNIISFQTYEKELERVDNLLEEMLPCYECHYKFNELDLFGGMPKGMPRQKWDLSWCSAKCWFSNLEDIKEKVLVKKEGIWECDSFRQDEDQDHKDIWKNLRIRQYALRDGRDGLGAIIA